MPAVTSREFRLRQRPKGMPDEGTFEMATVNVAEPPLSRFTDSARFPLPLAGQTEPALAVHSLEFVTPDVDATCRTLAAVHDTEFGEPVPALGNARTADITGGRSRKTPPGPR